MQRTTRRRVLAGLTGGLTGVAGCLGFTQGGDGGDGDDGDDSTSVEDTTTASGGTATTTGTDRAATAWPMFRSDDTNTGFSSVDAPTGDATRRWRVQFDAPVVASPAIADGVAFVATADGTAVAVAVDTGETLWTRSLEGRCTASPAVYDDRVLFVADTSLVALTRSSGDVAGREFITGGAQSLSTGRQEVGGTLDSSPTVVDDTVYVGGRDGSLHVVDAPSMSHEQRLPLGRTGAAGLGGGRQSNPNVSTTPAVFDGTVTVAGPDGTMTNLTVSNGVTNWFRETGQGVLASPAADADRVYVRSDRLVAVSRVRGEVQWRSRPFGDLTAQAGRAILPSPAVGNGRVVVPVEGRVVAFDVASGDRQWESSTLRRASNVDGQVVDSSPAMTDDTVYVGGVNDGLFALSLADGSNDWVGRLDGRTRSSPAVSDGVVVVGDDAGSVHAFEAA